MSILTPQQLENASSDVNSLEQFINAAPNTVITTRLGRKIKPMSALTAIAQIQVVPTGEGTIIGMILNSTNTQIKFNADNAPNFTLVLTQGTGANKVQWPSNIKWQHGIAPALSYTQGSVDLMYFITLDKGSTWLGAIIGGGYQ